MLLLTPQAGANSELPALCRQRWPDLPLVMMGRAGDPHLPSADIVIEWLHPQGTAAGWFTGAAHALRFRLRGAGLPLVMINSPHVEALPADLPDDLEIRLTLGAGDSIAALSLGRALAAGALLQGFAARLRDCDLTDPDFALLLTEFFQGPSEC